MKVARLVAVLLAASAIAACSLPVSKPGPAPQQYLLSAEFSGDAAGPETGPVLVVARPRASAGFDSPLMLYLERPGVLDAFANNRWAASPADMLEPLLVDALAATGRFRAVVDGGSGLGADLRLDTEVLRLQQEFFHSPSKVRLELRAVLVDAGSGEVMFARTFKAVEEAAGNDPDSGAVAANAATARLLERLAGEVAAAVPASR